MLKTPDQYRKPKTQFWKLWVVSADVSSQLSQTWIYSDNQVSNPYMIW
jgi:hypothetical protein